MGQRPILYRANEPREPCAHQTPISRRPSSARRETDFVRPRRQPHYRLRIGEVGVFYDVSGSTREILAIVAKSEATSGLGQFADPA